MFKCWILLKPVLAAWTVVCTCQYRPWTGSIKLSLQHFQFCRFGLSLGIHIFSICNPVVVGSILSLGKSLQLMSDIEVNAIYLSCTHINYRLFRIRNILIIMHSNKMFHLSYFRTTNHHFHIEIKNWKL
jgi:hypothetical protein